MQNQMSTHALNEEQMEFLLRRVPVGALATLSEDGAPYALPVHFVYDKGLVYIHGLPKGQKLDNIARDGRVSFTAWEMGGLLLDPEGRPCHTNTKYESVVIVGRAGLVEDPGEREAALEKIVFKYTPHLKGVALPQNMLEGTAVVKISPEKTTGKYM